MSDDITLRPMREADLAAANRVFRMAFGTFFGFPDPMQFGGDGDILASRLWAYPDGGVVACRDDGIVGLSFASRWGSFGMLGPVAVLPDQWRHGLARRLVGASVEIFARWNARLAGLFTFPQSPLHLRLYQSHDFWPRHLSPVMAKPAKAGPAVAGAVALQGSPDRHSLAAQCRELGGSLYAGLDLGREIDTVLTRGSGDVIALTEGSRVAGFAICQAGKGSEFGTQQVYMKFAAARPGPGAAERLRALIGACETYAALRGVATVVAGCSTGRIGAYRTLCELGFRTELPGVMMHRPFGPAWDGPDDWVLDDWR
jgi:GNAT superfamily N-acetyltransferase